MRERNLLHRFPPGKHTGPGLARKKNSKISTTWVQKKGTIYSEKSIPVYRQGGKGGKLGPLRLKKGKVLSATQRKSRLHAPKEEKGTCPPPGKVRHGHEKEVAACPPPGGRGMHFLSSRSERGTAFHPARSKAAKPTCCRRGKRPWTPGRARRRGKKESPRCAARKKRMEKKTYQERETSGQGKVRRKEKEIVTFGSGERSFSTGKESFQKGERSASSILEKEILLLLPLKGRPERLGEEEKKSGHSIARGDATSSRRRREVRLCYRRGGGKGKKGGTRSSLSPNKKPLLMLRRKRKPPCSRAEGEREGNLSSSGQLRREPSLLRKGDLAREWCSLRKKK